jgi:two-component system cell cycle sensor histidine kinase/response regulator CckA
VKDGAPPNLASVPSRAAGPLSTQRVARPSAESARPAGPEAGSADEVGKLREELNACYTTLDDWSRAETSWTQQRRLFKVMTENVTDLIVLMDPSGNRLWNNPAYSHALGHQSSELAGTYALSEVHPDDRPRAVEAFEKALAGKAAQQSEYRVQKKEGGWLQLQTEIIPVLAADGRVESLIFVAHDVTEIKRLEEALGLASSQSTAKGMVEAMARDFDQILTNAFGNLSIARNLNGTQNAVSVRLSEIERSLQRARDLLEQMFSLSPESGQPRVRAPLEPLVQEAVNAVLRGTFVRAEYNFARNLPELDLERDSFLLAIRNLITNSLQAMEKGVIRITAEFISQEQFAQRTEIPLKPGNYVCLRIQDQGQGMNEKTALHAFEPYFTTRPGAQGLGLTTALSAVQRLGGTILLDSTPTVGTTTYVYLPAPHAPAKSAAGRPNLAATGALTAPATEKKRILLMDDEQMILDIVSRMLTHLGYEVLTCTNGAQAIAAFAKAKTNGQPFDVVLMDLVIPNGVGGQDAVHTIRKIDPQAKVIASSGHLEHPVMIDHKKFGFVAVLEKPYKLERLQQVIDTVIESPV